MSLVERESMLHSTPEIYLHEDRRFARDSGNHALHTLARHCEVDVVCRCRVAICTAFLRSTGNDAVPQDASHFVDGGAVDALGWPPAVIRQTALEDRNCGRVDGDGAGVTRTDHLEAVIVDDPETGHVVLVRDHEDEIPIQYAEVDAHQRMAAQVLDGHAVVSPGRRLRELRRGTPCHIVSVELLVVAEEAQHAFAKTLLGLSVGPRVGVPLSVSFFCAEVLEDRLWLIHWSAAVRNELVYLVAAAEQPFLFIGAALPEAT